MCPPDNIYLIAGVIQHLFDGSQQVVATEHLHANQLGGENHIVGNVLPVELHSSAPQPLGLFHGIDALCLQEIAGLLNPAGHNPVFLSVDSAPVKIAQILGRIQPAKHLHLPTDPMGGDNLTGIYKWEFHVIQLLYFSRIPSCQMQR